MENLLLVKHISWQKMPGNEAAFVYNIKTRLYYILEDTEYYIWDLLVKRTATNVESIIRNCATYYDIDASLIEEDIKLFVESLKQIGVIQDG